MNPVSLHLHTNAQCNMKCSFCNTRQRRSSWKPGDMSVEMARYVLRVFPSLRETWLGGPGEVLLYKNLPDLLRELKKIGQTVHITTNGTLAASSKHVPWDLVSSVTVSLLEASPRKYAETTGAKLYDHALTGVEFLLRRVPYVEIASVVSRDTVADMPSFLDLASSLGVQGVAFRNLSWVPGEDWRTFRERKALRVEVPGLVESIRQTKINAPRHLRIRWPAVSDFLKLKRDRCPALRNMLVVDGNGDVAFCCRGPGPRAVLGNIGQGRAVWTNAEMERLRAKILGAEAEMPDKCLCCFAPYEEVL